MINFNSPCTGVVKTIENFPDEVFAQKDLGDGLTIEINDNKIVAPFDGVINVVYPTGHAICLTSDDGIQLMIHIGADTYSIQGLNKIYCSVDQKVKKGDLLLKTNYKELIKKTGNSYVALVFLNKETVEELSVGPCKTLDEICKVKVND